MDAGRHLITSTDDRPRVIDLSSETPAPPAPRGPDDLGELPGWILELAEGWRRSAKTEAEMAFWHEQVAEIRRAFDDQARSNESARRALEAESRRAVAQAAHAAIQAKTATELVERQTLNSQAIGDSRRNAEEAAALASRVAEEAGRRLAAHEKATSIDTAERAESVRRAAEEADRASQSERSAAFLLQETARVAEDATERIETRAGEAIEKTERSASEAEKRALEGARAASERAVSAAQQIAVRAQHEISAAGSEAIAALNQSAEATASRVTSVANAAVEEARQDLSQLRAEGRAVVTEVEDNLRATAHDSTTAIQQLVATATVETVNSAALAQERIDSVLRIAVQAAQNAAEEAREAAAQASAEEADRAVALAKAEIAAAAQSALRAAEQVSQEVQAAASVTREDLRAHADANAARMEEATGAAIAGLRRAIADSQVHVDEQIKAAIRSTNEIVASAEERASRTAVRESRKAAEQTAAEAAEKISEAQAEFTAGVAKARVEIEGNVRTLESSLTSSLEAIATGARERTDEIARRAEAAALQAAEEASKGAVSQEAQERAAQAAEMSAKVAREAAASAEREAAARAAQEMSAAAAEKAAVASSEMAATAQSALEHTFTESRELHALQEAVAQDLREAKDLVRSAVAEISQMIWQHSVSAAALHQEQQAILKTIEDAAKSAQGSARAAQASSVAAQRDALRVASAAPEGDENLEASAVTAAPATPWEELERELAVEEPSAPSEGFWDLSVQPEEPLAQLDDDGSPLLERVWTRFRHHQH